MTNEAEALAAVLAKIAPLNSTSVPLIEALGRFAARDVLAQIALPVFDNSAMDGYAVVAQSARAGARLRVIGEQPAGEDRRLTLPAGKAIRIFTGAPLPAGADAVVMQEDVILEGDTIVLQENAAPGEFVRRKGIDLAQGQKILDRGQRINAQLLALLSSQGMAQIEVGARPRLAIVATGDELARAGDEPRAGQIFESNSIMLRALAEQAGAEIGLIEHCPDHRDRLEQTFASALENDILIASGGVSVGEHDLVKPALRSLGAEIDLWRVAIKPGKPFLFGRAGNCAIFGLPGNPVSAFVTFLKFARPAILKMMGAGPDELGLREVRARLTTAANNDSDRPHYLRGRLQGDDFTTIGRQESHALFGLSRANALARLPPASHFAAGEIIMVELLPSAD